MKHKISAIDYAEFNVLFDGLLERLKQTNQTITKAEFRWDNDTYEGFRAKVWSEKMEGGAE